MISFSTTVSPGMLSTPSRRNAGLKPISSGSPRKSQGSDSRPSPTSCVCAETVSSPGVNAQPQRRAPGQDLDAGDHVGELRARQRDLVLERVRQQPPELGELPLDATGAEPDLRRAEEHLVLLDDDLELALARQRGGDADEIGERARRHDRRQLLRRSALELRRSHRHAVGVGRGHRQHAVGELDEDAGQHGARVVARGGAQHALGGLEERVLVDVEGAAVVDVRQPREVVGVVGVQRVAGWRRTRASAGPARRPTSARRAAAAGGARCRAAAGPERRRDRARARRPRACRGPTAPCRSPRARPAPRHPSHRSGRRRGSARSSAATRRGPPPGGA